MKNKIITDRIIPESNKMGRVFFWDYMKAFAIVLVLINHSLTDKTSLWFICIVRMAVPIFLLISGFTFSLSIKRNASVATWYEPTRLMKKICYYSIPPFLICTVYSLFKGNGIPGFIRCLLLADYGMGAYYYNILIQLILIFPLIYIIVNNKRGGENCL